MRIKVPLAEARHLLHVVGEDPLRLESELRKLADYVGAGRRGSRRGAAGPTSTRSARRAWRRRSGISRTRWGKKDGPAAFRVLEELFALGGAPRRAGGASGDPARSIFVALARHVDLLRRVPTSSPASRPRRPPPPCRCTASGCMKLLEQRQTFGARTVARAMVVLAEADAALVGGSQLEPELVLERALLRLVS